MHTGSHPSQNTAGLMVRKPKDYAFWGGNMEAHKQYIKGSREVRGGIFVA